MPVALATVEGLTLAARALKSSVTTSNCLSCNASIEYAVSRADRERVAMDDDHCVRARRSERMRKRLNWWSQAKTRSTNPAHLAQSGTVGNAASGDHRLDVEPPQQAAVLVEVVAPIGVQAQGLAAGAPRTPRIDGTASSSGRSWVTLCRLPPVGVTANGQISGYGQPTTAGTVVGVQPRASAGRDRGSCVKWSATWPHVSVVVHRGR